MSRRILLADDSVTIQKVIELTFMDEDFEVTAVSNGDEAVALLPRLQPDFVIADVHMPGANGYEVCRRVKAVQPEVPVLLLVGTFEPFDESQARAAGSDAFLKKPFDSQELLHLVQQLLDKAGTPAGPAGPAPKPAAPPPPAALSSAETVLQPLPAFLSAPAGETAWSNFEIEAEPELPAPPPANLPELASPADEPIFELEPELESLAVVDEPQCPVEPIYLDELPVEPPVPAAGATAPAGLSDSDVDRIARRLVELIGERLVKDIAWEVVPDLAEVAIKNRLRELESQVE